MQPILLLATQPAAGEYEPFVHGELKFVFERLAATGPRKLVEGPAWAFVDWIIPELSGLELCRRLRADRRTSGAHITMILEHDDVEDRRRALRAGADDYMVGPATRQSMLDRVLALQALGLPRAPSQIIELGPLQIDVGAEQVRRGKRLVPLSQKGFRLLRFLAENPNRVITRRELVEALGTGGDPEHLRTADVWIKRLRAGLREVGAGHMLRTVTGKGYVLDAP